MIRNNMNKATLLLIFALAIIQVHAQTLGNQQAIKVKNASYGSTQNALISLPDDYDKTTEKYPLIIFLHGYGEVGNTTTDLNKLLKQGLPAVIAKGVNIQATHEGKLYKFVVVSPQHHGWTTEPAQLDYMVGELARTYRVDTDRIYLTGLSAGGQGVIQAVTYSQSLTNKIAAIVPMSPSAPDNSFIKRFGFFAASKTGAWFLSGKSDPGNYTDNARRYNDSINRYSPGGSKLTLYTGGHCCWVNIYDTSYREGGKNIYEWMLTHKKGSAPEPPKPPKVDTMVIKCVGCGITAADVQKVRKAIILMKDGSYREIDSTIMNKLLIELK
jgi:poly(3-hydroxybutyrate) depolymerase